MNLMLSDNNVQRIAVSADIHGTSASLMNNS